MPVPKKKYVRKSDARKLCEEFIAEFGVDHFSSMVRQLKKVYYDKRRFVNNTIPDCITASAHSYQASTDTHLTDGELKMILGHVINVSDWWSGRKPVPAIHEGEPKGQQQLFLPNLVFPEDPEYEIIVLIHNRRIAKS